VVKMKSINIHLTRSIPILYTVTKMFYCTLLYCFYYKSIIYFFAVHMLTKSNNRAA
jgi:hypothetical protein